MSEFSIIGKSIPRLDGPAKVTGESEYVGDLNFPGLWVGGTVRSGVPHGKLKSIRQDPSFDWSSVVFVTAKDIQGTPFVHIVRDDYPALASETITYATQAVALIAAPDEKTLKAALAAVTLEIEPLPAVLTVKEALEGKEIVWGTDNILDEYHVNQGDIEQGFADADIIVEGQYETGLQEQIYLETQGMIARPMPDGSMEIIGSIQCPFYVLGGVAGVLNLPCEKVRVKLAEVGGAFGGKEDYTPFSPSMPDFWRKNRDTRCGLSTIVPRISSSPQNGTRLPSTTRRESKKTEPLRRWRLISYWMEVLTPRSAALFSNAPYCTPPAGTKSPTQKYAVGPSQPIPPQREHSAALVPPKRFSLWRGKWIKLRVSWASTLWISA